MFVCEQKNFCSSHVSPSFCNEFRNMSREPLILKEMKIKMLAFTVQDILLTGKSKLSVKQKMRYQLLSVSLCFTVVNLISH